MANLPYLTGNEDKVLGILKMYSRMGAYPLDATSVFNTKADLLGYISEAGSYAYPGQVVAVANGNINNSAQDDDYSLYVIRSDRTVQEIGKNLTFSSMDAATAFIASNENSIRVGELVTITDEVNGFELYMVNSDKTLKRMSFNASDVPDVTWANLQNKPTSAVTDIDDAVTKKHEHTNKAALDKISDTDGKPAYNNNELAYKSDIKWETLADKPTSVEGYGINDVYTKTQADGLYIKNTEVSTTAEANKLLKLDDNAKVPVSILSGIIPIENLPHGALERCVVVEDDAARFALTTASVQTGDTVKVNATGTMFFVKDDTKLNSEEGYEVYTAGSASNVAWSGVTGTPTTISGYGITDAVNVSDVVSAAEPNKILKLDDAGMLPADITGNAATVGGKQASDFVPATDVVDSAEANKLLKLNADGVLPASITGDAATVGGKQASDFVPATDISATAAANKLLKLNADGVLPADITGNAATATNVAWTGVQNKPTTLSGYGITDAIANTDIVDVAEANKVLRLNDQAKLPADITGNAATASTVEWTGVQNTPVTVAGYGITDVFTKDEVNNNFVNKTELTTSAEANKVLKLNSEAKLPADITGNAATATNVAWSGVQNTPTTVAGYGITDVYTKTESDGAYVPVTDVVSSASANKVLRLDADGKLPASILSGVIPMANMPHGALERCVIVANDTARFALTNIQVQTGDTVKVTSTGKMYFVIDDTKLGTEAGYEVYSAGSATSVPWSGVTGTPTTISGYGITDAFTKDEVNNNFVNKTDVSDSAAANKLLKLNSESKLPADITGNAATATNVAWSGVQNTPTTVAGYGITDTYTKTEAGENFVAKTDVVESAAANKLLKLNADGKLPASITGSAGSVEWANVTGKPSSAATEIDDAVNKRHEHSNKTQLDKFGANADGKLTYDTDNVVAYMSDLTAAISVGATAPAEMPTGGLWLDTSMSA